MTDIKQTAAARGTAIVTGGASGFGAAAAVRLSQEGWAVAVLDIDGAAAHRVADSIKAAGGSAGAFECDVADQEAVDAVIDAAVAELGEISALFNNAGINGKVERWGEVTAAAMRKMFDVNLVGPINVLNAAVRSMRRRGGGAVVNTASTTSFKGYGNARPAYIVSKHGIVGLTKEAAVQLAKEKIRVNAVAPGVADTPMMQRVHEAVSPGNPQAAKDKWTAAIPDGRYATVEDVVEAVVFLLNPVNSHITGTTISVDGGETAV